MGSAICGEAAPEKKIGLRQVQKSERFRPCLCCSAESLLHLSQDAKVRVWWALSVFVRMICGAESCAAGRAAHTLM